MADIRELLQALRAETEGTYANTLTRQVERVIETLIKDKTGAYSPVGGETHLEMLIKIWKREAFEGTSKGYVTIVAVDVNGLKKVNDSRGHAAGDALIQRTVDALTPFVCRPTDFLWRTGGDEFLLILPTGEDSMHASELRSAIEAQMDQRCVSASLGIVNAVVQDEGDWDAAAHTADERMYQDKDKHYGV